MIWFGFEAAEPLGKSWGFWGRSRAVPSAHRASLPSRGGAESRSPTTFFRIFVILQSEFLRVLVMVKCESAGKKISGRTNGEGFPGTVTMYLLLWEGVSYQKEKGSMWASLLFVSYFNDNRKMYCSSGLQVSSVCNHLFCIILILFFLKTMIFLHLSKQNNTQKRQIWKLQVK